MFGENGNSENKDFFGNFTVLALENEDTEPERLKRMGSELWNTDSEICKEISKRELL